MRSALTRTRNEIAQVEVERERLLAGYRRCAEARPAVRLACAGVLNRGWRRYQPKCFLSDFTALSEAPTNSIPIPALLSSDSSSRFQRMIPFRLTGSSPGR